jgi:hypothetical protein
MTVSTPPFIQTNFANSEHTTTRHHTQQHGHNHDHDATTTRHHHEVGTRPLREWPPNGERRHLSPFIIVFYSVRTGPCPLFLSTNNFRCHVAVGDVGTIRRTTTDVVVHRHFLFYVYLCMYSSFLLSSSFIIILYSCNYNNIPFIVQLITKDFKVSLVLFSSVQLCSVLISSDWFCSVLIGSDQF